jgi:hypothetical protein
VRILDRYMLGSWIRIFLLTVVGFPLVDILLKATERVGRLLERDLSPGTIVLSYLYLLPEHVADDPGGSALRRLHPGTILAELRADGGQGRRPSLFPAHRPAHHGRDRGPVLSFTWASSHPRVSARARAAEGTPGQHDHGSVQLRLPR